MHTAIRIIIAIGFAIALPSSEEAYQKWLLHADAMRSYFASSLSALPAGDSIIAHSPHRVPPHLITMRVVVRVIFAMFFVSIAAMLQGCGCDEDAGKKCFAATASTCATLSKCVDDASCCDFEMEDATTKIKVKVSALVAISCLATPAETNACA